MPWQTDDGDMGLHVTPRAEASGGDAGRAASRGRRLSAQRIPSLDGFRGWAVLAVIFYHFSLPIIAAGAHGIASKALLHFLATGSVGVDMFFALSGFLITGILLDSREEPGYFRNFYMRRVLRIFPLYYGVLLVVFGMLWWTRPIQPFVPHQAWLWLYVANFAGLRQVSMVPMFDHFWSLAVEEQFYLAWPIMVFLLPRRRLLHVALWLIGGSLVLRCALIGSGALGAELAAGLTPCRLEGLLLGSVLAIIQREPGALSALRRPAIVVGTLAALAAMLSRGVAGAQSVWGLSGVGHFTVPVAFTCVLALAAGGQGMWATVLSMRWLRFFGKYSYGLYVFHYLFEPWLDRWFWLLPAWPVASIVLHMILALAATLAVALASWHLYEKQFLKLKRWFEPGAHASPMPVPDRVSSGPAATEVAGPVAA
ncbi:MAG TPA: acyltransferase [Tepidisphaeraceae bacterium]|jgi:peptidoglycan/LPS O-acetylase OafA/YrhL|nr:acyltransferase [Tepidisphaeraceae bacterium]